MKTSSRLDAKKFTKIICLPTLLCHFGFRRSVPVKSIKYRSLFYPISSIIALISLLSIVVIMLFMEDMRMAVFLMPFWICLVSVMFLIANSPIKNSKLRMNALHDLPTKK